jgi:hypothetical protein
MIEKRRFFAAKEAQEQVRCKGLFALASMVDIICCGCCFGIDGEYNMLWLLLWNRWWI